MKLTYQAKVIDGKITLPPKTRGRMAEESAKAFDGKSIVITIEARKRSRSPQQNAYYWGVVVPLFSSLLKTYSPDMVVNPDLCHEFLKRRFLPMVTDWEEYKITTPEGTEEVIMTTTVLSTIQFMDYIALIQQYAAEYGWEIPDPYEIEGELTNVDAK